MSELIWIFYLILFCLIQILRLRIDFDLAKNLILPLAFVGWEIHRQKAKMPIGPRSRCIGNQQVQVINPRVDTVRNQRK